MKEVVDTIKLYYTCGDCNTAIVREVRKGELYNPYYTCGGCHQRLGLQECSMCNEAATVFKHKVWFCRSCFDIFESDESARLSGAPEKGTGNSRVPD